MIPPGQSLPAAAGMARRDDACRGVTAAGRLTARTFLERANLTGLIPVANPSADSRRLGSWWVHPITLILGVSVSTLLITLRYSDSDFRFLWRTPRTITDAQVMEWVLLLLVFAGAVAATLAIRPSRTAEGAHLPWHQVRLLLIAERVFFWLTVTGYLMFVLLAVRSGVIGMALAQFEALDFSSGTVKTGLGTVPGVTTLTQFGVAQVVTAGVLLSGEGPKLFRRRLVTSTLIVLMLAVLRALVLTERLAVLELVIPLLAAATSGIVRQQWRHRVAQWTPVALVPAVVALFGAFEYTRSWQWYVRHGRTNFSEFILDRIIGYYVTAYNNGAIRADYGQNPLLPHDTVEWFWNAPGPGTVNLYQKLSGIDPLANYFEVLGQYGQPEFNNVAGISSVIMDYGYWGAMAYFILFGIVIALLYVSCREGHIAGLLFYPLIFLTLLELPRYIWMNTGRAFPSMLGLIIVALVAHTRRMGSASWKEA